MGRLMVCLLLCSCASAPQTAMHEEITRLRGIVLQQHDRIREQQRRIDVLLRKDECS